MTALDRTGKARTKWLGIAALVSAIGLGLFLRSWVSSPGAGPHGGPLLVEDPSVLAALEERGLSFDRVVGKDRLEAIARVVESDIAELRRGDPETTPLRPFRPEWLATKRARFELVGVVNRIDRRRFHSPPGADACGEVRLVYRLAIANPRRPVSRLPFTLNVRIPQPRDEGATDCRSVAERWRSRPDLTALVAKLPPPTQIEIDFQSFHIPGSQKDMDDSAEYVLRSFAVTPNGIQPDVLFNTPRADADPRELVAWIGANLKEIDEGSAVVPAALLATRAVSVSPRGLFHASNRPWSSRIRAEDLASVPLDRLALAKTPELLLRRLDEGTCQGCHQTRGVAGFHLLGEDRPPSTKAQAARAELPPPAGTARRVDASFNTLAVGHSPHVSLDLPWREADLAAAARGETLPRPFADRTDGELGAECGLAAGLRAWTCREGLVCRDIQRGDTGLCARPAADAPGDPCEDVTLAPSTRLEGPIVTAFPPDPTCPTPTPTQRGGKFCAPNWLGFTAGVCSERCSEPGTRVGDAICAPLPAAGYEAECLLTDEPVETCIARHLVTALVPACDATHPCRADYGCARVPNAPPGSGACVPPYFLFQARVDGPKLDR